MSSWRQRYLAYLNSEHWRAKRCLALIAAGHRCQQCGARHALQVHHLSYKRLGKEPLCDLQVLCKPCHFAKHPRKARRRKRSAALHVR